MGSVVVVRGLSCPTACGILVSQPGIKTASPALEGGFFTTGPPGKFLFFYNRRFLSMFSFYREKLNKWRIKKYIGKVIQHPGRDGTILNNEGFFSKQGNGNVIL